MAKAENTHSTPRRAVLVGALAGALAPAALAAATLPNAPTGHLAPLWARAQAILAADYGDGEPSAAAINEALDLHADVLRGEIRCDADALAKFECANGFVDMERVDGLTAPALADVFGWFKRQRA